MKMLFVIFGMLLSLSLNAQTLPKVKSKISNVTVFLSGAQVTRQGTVNLESGSQVVLIDNLPAQLNPQSIQVEGSGAFTILSVSHQMDFLQPVSLTREIKQLKDSLILLQDQVNIEKSTLTAIQEEEDFLKANKEIGGNNTGVNINDLKIASEYLRTRLTETGKQKTRINRGIVQLNEKIAALTNQLSSLNATNSPTSEVLVTLSASNPLTANLKISYIVGEAGWIPEYDVRAENISKPVDLTYKAGVFQNTGESWDKVSLTLSTGNPSLGGTKPDLQPWFLDFYQQAYPMKSKGYAPMSRVAEDKEEMALEETVVVGYGTAPTLANFTQVRESQTTTEYAISVPSDIPSDNKPHQVEIKKTILPADFAYYVVPKLDPDAFLVARISGWEELNLLSGNVNLYFEGTYVGQSFLDAATTSDTLNISLGRDKNINVKRERMKEFTSKQIVGGNRKDIRGFEITVRNRKKQEISVVIEDQIPVSTQKEIIIDATEISSAQWNKDSGKLMWKFRLTSGESKSLKLVYEVKYPKEKQVILE